MSYPQSPLKTDRPPDHPLLKQWLGQQDITVNEHVSPVFDKHAGWRVVANSDVKRGHILCAVPKASVFSHRTAALSKHLSLSPEPSTAEHTLYLAACLLHEIRLGQSSVFWPWLQVLPRETIPLPTFWADESVCGEDGNEALAWLRGTEGEKELRRKDSEGLSLDDIKAYFGTISSLMPLTETCHTAPTLAHYLYAFSMVSTRGYVIDAYHLIALIPFVDLFNHSASNHTSLASDSCVCPTCGSLAACEHDAGDTDRIAHLPPAYVAQSQAEGNRVDMRAERDIKAGEEIFSCYEEDVGDGKLFVEWGFLAREHVAVSWGPRDVLDGETGPAYMAVVSHGEVYHALEDVVGIDQWVHLPTDPGQFDVRQSGTLCLNLFVIAYLRSLESIPDSLEELEQGMLSVLQLVAGKEKAGSLSAISRVIDTLLAERLSAMRHEGTGGGAQSASESISDRPLTRMAMTLVQDERDVLERAISKWKNLV